MKERAQLGHDVDTKWRRADRSADSSHGRDESALSPLRREDLCIGSETYVVGRMQSPRHQHPSSDNLDRMTAKLVSTPTLCRALRFWRELYVDAENADAASGRAFRQVPEVLGHGTTGRHAHYDYVAVFHLQAVRV